MLRIKLGNTVVDLGESELPIVLTSPYPLMATGTQGGNYIFNFTLPATDELKQEFRYAHRPQVTDPFVELPYRIEAGKGITFEGTAKVSEATRDQYEVMCPVGNGDFNVAAKALKLSELDLGGDRVASFLDVLGFNFNINVSIAMGYLNLRIYINNELIHSIALADGANDISRDLNLKSGDQVTWDIISEAQQGVAPDEFEIDYNLTSATLTITNEGITQVDAEISDSIIYSAVDDETFTHAFDLPFDDITTNVEGMLSLSGLTAEWINTELESMSELRWPDQDFAVFPIENTEIFSNWDDDFYEIDNVSIKKIYNLYFRVINYWMNGGFPTFLFGETEIEENVTTVQSGNVFIPFPYFAYLIKQIAAHFNYSIENNPFDDELKYTVLVNHFIENEFLENDAKLIKPKTGFNLQDHVPDWTIYDFLKHLNNLFGMGYEVDNQKNIITFNFLDDIIVDEAYTDISHLLTEPLRVNLDRTIKGVKLVHKSPSGDKYFQNVKSLDGLNYRGVVAAQFLLPEGGPLNDCYFVTMLNGYYAWKYDPETYQFGWVRHSHNFIPSIEIGEEAVEFGSELCPVPMRSPGYDDTVLGGPIGRSWLIPASHQAGKFEGAPEMYTTKWAPGILFYHGLYPDSQDNDYPYASNDTLDPDGNEIEGADLSLRLDGAKGLYEKKWKRYLQKRISSPDIKAKIIPDDDFLVKLRFSKKLRIDGVKYLIVDYRGSISRTGAGIAELTLMPV